MANSRKVHYLAAYTHDPTKVHTQLACGHKDSWRSFTWNLLDVTCKRCLSTWLFKDDLYELQERDPWVSIEKAIEDQFSS